MSYNLIQYVNLHFEMYSECLHYLQLQRGSLQFWFYSGAATVKPWWHVAGKLIAYSLFFSMTISWWIYCRISITISTVSCVPELFCWPPWTRWVGRNHSGVGLTAGMVGDSGMPRAGITSAFPSGSSFNETRHIGQVVCFRNHTSKQIRWKLWRHVGMIRRISFSLYSPKHMEHLPKENIH
jgi:hypothetical protein